MISQGKELQCRYLLEVFSLKKKILFFRNPMGRTGLIGRGSLGRWGPNHAADPIVTRLEFFYDPDLKDPGAYTFGSLSVCP